MDDDIVDDRNPGFEEKDDLERCDHVVDRRLSDDDILIGGCAQACQITDGTVKLFGKEHRGCDVFQVGSTSNNEQESWTWNGKDPSRRLPEGNGERCTLDNRSLEECLHIAGDVVQGRRLTTGTLTKQSDL